MMNMKSLNCRDVISDHEKSWRLWTKELNTNTERKLLRGDDDKIESILLQSNVML